MGYAFALRQFLPIHSKNHASKRKTALGDASKLRFTVSPIGISPSMFKTRVFGWKPTTFLKYQIRFPNPFNI
jgi:hypothetical protein